MQKKILVIAVSAALALPAVAFADEDGNEAASGDVVELYGKVYPEIVRPHGSDPTPAGTTVSTLAAAPTGHGNIVERTEVQSSNSRFGVRGQESLGPNLKAVFQLETEFHLDSNDTAFAQRDSFVGLDQKQFGTIKLGRMDTPFKRYGDEIAFLGISSGNFVSTSNVLRKTGFGTNSASSFHLRRQNAIQYESPTYAGVHGAVQYSTDEADTSQRHPHVWSAGVEWKGGPFHVSAGFEQHWDLFGGSRNAPAAMSNFADQNVRSKDKAWEVEGIWQFARGQRIMANYTRKQYNENPYITGRFQSYKNNSYEVAWDARWSSAWRTMLEYIHADKGSCSRLNAACTTDGLDGYQVNAGVSYYFSRRTYMFLIGALLRNGFSARYNNSDLQSPSVGEDITQYALGLNHSF